MFSPPVYRKPTQGDRYEISGKRFLDLAAEKKKFWHFTITLLFFSADGNSDWDLITQNDVNAAIMICYKSIETTNVMFSPSERTPFSGFGYTHTHTHTHSASLDIFWDYINSLGAQFAGKKKNTEDYFLLSVIEPLTFYLCLLFDASKKVKRMKIFIPFPPRSVGKQASESFRLGLV